jgi:hypothetical protein
VAFALFNSLMYRGMRADAVKKEKLVCAHEQRPANWGGRAIERPRAAVLQMPFEQSFVAQATGGDFICQPAIARVQRRRLGCRGQGVVQV